MLKLFRSLFLLFVAVGSLVLDPVTPVYAASLPAEINKQFTPLQIDAGGVSVMRVTIFNPNSFPLTDASWVDNLVGVQPGLSIANPAGVVNTCGAVGDVTAVPGTTNLVLSNGTVPAQAGPNPGECYVEVNVTSVTSGNLINTIPANNLNSQGDDGGTIVNITNTTPASATITVIAVTPPSLTKGFSPNTIFIGSFSRLTITLNNNDNDTNLTGTSYTDTLPAGLVLRNPVNASVTGCGGGVSLNATPGGNTIAISNATVTPSTNCVVAVDVIGASGLYTAGNGNPNTIPAGPGGPGSIQTNQGVTNNSPATADLTIQPVDIDKAFSPVNFQAGGTTTLTITLRNPTATLYTNVHISDTLPGAFVVNNFVSNTCAGTVTAVPGTNLISLNNGTIPASATPPTPATCVITVLITSPVASTGTNTIPANNLSSPDHPGLTNITSASANITAYAVGVGLNGTKSFSPSTIDPGQNTRIRIDLTAPADTNLTNFSIIDDLSLLGLTITNSTPASKTANCIGGTLSAPTGGTIISWTGGTINAGQLCRIDVFVTSNTPGTITNIITPTDISNDQNRGPASNITANLTVRQPSDLSSSKAFYPTQVVPNGISTLTITLQNTNNAPLINVSVLDNLNTMGGGGNLVDIASGADYSASTTCGGTLTAVAGTQIISLTNGTIPAQVGAVPGICTITVNVQAGTTTSTRTNTLPRLNVSGTIQGIGTIINPESDATATLQVLPLTIGVVKGFNPVLVYGGASSTLSVQLINPNNATLVGIEFTDDMTLLGSGMIIATPANFNVGTCGVSSSISGNPGDTSFTFSGGTLPPNSSCIITLSVTMQVNGNLTNLIEAGAVTTLNGVSSPDPTEASLTNLPGVSVNKAFNPATVLSGQASTLTITIANTSLVPVVNMGMADNLPGTLPDGLEIANPSNAVNTCGGTLIATPGSQIIQLTGGELEPFGDDGDVCIISVDVISTRPGVYVNTIPAGALTADGGVTNNNPTTDTLTVNSNYSLGNRVWFDTDNSSTINGSEVGVNGVTVQLYAADASGNPTGAVLATQTTANGGYYRFDNLPAGDYVVVVPSTQFASGAPLAGYYSSGTTLSGAGVITETIAPDPDNDVDNDDNGTRQTAGAFNGAVISQAVTLGPNAVEPTNDTDVDPTNPAGEAENAQSNRTVDFGFYRVELGNLVFVDANSNGTFDAGDTPLAGAGVQLFASNGITEINVGPDGILGTVDDGPGGVTTGAGGTYLFSGLPQGDYIVRVTPPVGYASTVDTFDNADTTNPNTNADNNDNGVGEGIGQVSSNPVSLTPGSVGAASNNTVNNANGTTTNPTVDFGFRTSSGLAKTIVGTNETFTTGNDVAIGEIVTYEVVIDLPVGSTFTNTTITDQLDLGLAFVECVSVFVQGVDETANVCPPAVTPAVGTSVNPADDGRQVIFTLPSPMVVTAPAQQIVIQYRAIVLDVIENQDGVQLNNSVTWAWTGGSFTTTAPTVRIVEPDLAIDKSATPNSNVPVGTPVQFTLVIDHTTPQSQADAFDVVVTDILPATLEYVQCTVQYTAGLAPDTLASDYCNPGQTTTDLIFEWAVFPLGQTSTITFNARLIGSPAVNEASVAWTSLPIDPQLNGLPVQLSAHNSTSTERWYDPLDDVNIYAVSDSVTINSPIDTNPPPTDDTDTDATNTSLNLPFFIPVTGFAPNVVTKLPEQTQEKAYRTTDVWLEIPRLGVKMPIVGVPLVDENWDVSWLWGQAGWLDGTAFPGWLGNSGLTSHATLPNGQEGPFAKLGNLKWGDRIIVHAYGTAYIYEVRKNSTISPYNMTVLGHKEDAWLTLITCKNYNEAKNTYENRIAVQAVLIKVTEDTATYSPKNIR